MTKILTYVQKKSQPNKCVDKEHMISLKDKF